MALIERLMGLEQPHIPVHTFFAANEARIDGPLTRTDIVNFWAMDTAAQADYDALAALAPTGTQALDTARKAMFMEKIHAVLLLAEARFPGFDTPALVRAKLGI